jgi:hypothetical protein
MADSHATADQPNAVRLADVNADGLLDVIVSARTANNNPSVADVFLNQGGLAFTRVQNATTMLRAAEFDVGDIDRDGYPDLVILSQSEVEIEILEGNGDGTFTTRGTVPAVNGGSVGLADLDKDGDLDLVQTRGTSTGVQSYPNTDPASFTFGAAQLRASVGSPKSMAFGDLNRDGEIDLVAGSDVTDGGMHVYFGE